MGDGMPDVTSTNEHKLGPCSLCGAVNCCPLYHADTGIVTEGQALRYSMHVVEDDRKSRAGLLARWILDQGRIPEDPKTWNMTAAVAFLRRLEPVLESVGWHCALGGGVLQKGESAHDLDVVVFPRSSKRVDMTKLRNALRAAGLRQWMNASTLRRRWREKGSDDEKHVEVWMLDKRRVDIIVPMAARDRRENPRGRHGGKEDRREPMSDRRRTPPRRIADKRRARIRK